MGCEQVMYLFSLSLQVTGALILIIFCWGNTERRVLNAIYPANTEMYREEDNTVTIRTEKLYKAHKVILFNRISFIFIGLGCLLGLFGSNDGICPWLGLFTVIVASCFLVVIMVFVAHLIAKFCNKEDKVYPYEELRSKLDSDIMTNATIQESNDAVNELT